MIIEIILFRYSTHALFNFLLTPLFVVFACMKLDTIQYYTPPPTNSTTGSWGGSWPHKRLNLAEHLNGLDNDLRLVSVIAYAGAGIIAHHNFLLQVLIDKIAEFDTHQLQISVTTHSQIIKCQIKYHCPGSYFNAVMTRERSTSI